MPLSNGVVHAAQTPERDCHAAGGRPRLRTVPVVYVSVVSAVCPDRTEGRHGEFRVGFGCWSAFSEDWERSAQRLRRTLVLACVVFQGKGT